MASAPHMLGEQRATVPRITLPITSRGLALTDRVCWVIFGLAMVAAAGLILYLNRGTTFFLDELVHVYNSPTLVARYVLEPVNGHLGVTSKLVYKGVLETFGTDYLVFRLLHAFMVVVAGAVFYALVKRRVGALPALAPALVLLFFGSAFSHTVIPIGFGIFFCVAAGLGALLALERNDFRGDLIAVVLLSLSIVTFTIGLAFLVGAATYVLIRPERRRRAWVFVVPLLLYAAWYLWSLSTASAADEETKLSNILLFPSYVAESLALVTAGIVGLDYDFNRTPYPGEIGWGRILAVAAVVALALRIRRGGLPSSLWVSLAILLAYWLLGALAVDPDLRGPVSTRYLYPGAVLVLLVATDAARSIRFSKLGLAALFAVCAVSLATNLALMRDGAAFFRQEYSPGAMAQFATLELARDRVSTDFDPAAAAPDAATVGARAGTYFTVVDRYGSLGFSLAQLQRQSEPIRENADKILTAALELRLVPSSRRQPADGCRRVRADTPGGPIFFDLPFGASQITMQGSEPGEVTLGRFATFPTAELGNLAAGETATLRIPRDASSEPWQASVTGVRSVDLCDVR